MSQIFKKCSMKVRAYAYASDHVNSGAAGISGRGWGTLKGVGLVGVPGADPRGSRELSKFSKDFLRKLQKMHYFGIFFYIF